ncbi:MAG: Bacterial regulatory protein luxR family [Actinomycetota bacterium]|nr:Bacterial regulatory protein luxR family [Actinomycetota bacterium]
MDSMAEDGHPFPAEDNEEKGPEGWLFLRPNAVPERWRARAIPMAFIPLLPEEAAALTEGGTAAPPEQSGGEEFLKLVARGLSARIIARQLGISPRSVHRRTARLRDRLEVGSTAELAAELSRRGF